MILPSVVWSWVRVHNFTKQYTLYSPFHSSDNDERPPWPVGSKYVTQQLQDLVRACWDQDPAKRPSFADIVPLTKSIRKATPFLIENFSSPRISELPELGLEDPIKSPDIRPIVLPIEEISCMQPYIFPSFFPLIYFITASRQPDDFGLADSDQRPHKETSVPTPEIRFPEPVFFSPTGSRQSSVLVSPLENSEGGSHGTPIPIQDTHASPPPENDIIAQIRNERRYRMILTHDYHPSRQFARCLFSRTKFTYSQSFYLCGSHLMLTWELLDTFLSPEVHLSLCSMLFIPICLLWVPFGLCLRSMDMGVWLVVVNGFRSGTRSLTPSWASSRWGNKILACSRKLNHVHLPKISNRSPICISQPVSRRYSFPLKAGHRAAFLCAEATEYRYMISEEGEQLDAPKRWFKANVDAIMKIFGAQHQIQREELFLGRWYIDVAVILEFWTIWTSCWYPSSAQLCSFCQS